jgi:hypothetical protein
MIFNRLPGFAKSAPGLERRVLRGTPKALLIGTLLLALPSVVIRMLPADGNATDVSTRVLTVDIYGISFVILHWIVVLTAAMTAFVVMVMKGPAYVADAYPLSDADRPRTPPAE